MSKIKNYKKMQKNLLFVYCSDYPHGPFQQENEFKDIFMIILIQKISFKYEKGYYQNILNDNNQLNEILDFIEINEKDENILFIYASDGGLRGKWSLMRLD